MFLVCFAESKYRRHFDESLQNQLQTELNKREIMENKKGN